MRGNEARTQRQSFGFVNVFEIGIVREGLYVSPVCCLVRLARRRREFIWQIELRRGRGPFQLRDVCVARIWRTGSACWPDRHCKLGGMAQAQRWKETQRFVPFARHLAHSMMIAHKTFSPRRWDVHGVSNAMALSQGLNRSACYPALLFIAP